MPPIFHKNYNKEQAEALTKAVEVSMAKIFTEEKSNGKENGTFSVVMTTETTDRHGEIVKQDGGDFKNFKKNPVLLFGHNSFDLPIGKITKIRHEGKKTIAEGVFASAEANPFAQQVRALHDEGILKAVSIGFMTKKRNETDSSIIEEWELLELSFVPIPANPQALSTLKEKGFKSLDLDMLDFGSKEVEKKDDDDDDDEEESDELEETEKYFVQELRSLEGLVDESFISLGIKEGVQAKIAMDLEGNVSAYSLVFDKEDFTKDECKEFLQKNESIKESDFSNRYFDFRISQNSVKIIEVKTISQKKLDETRKISKGAVANIAKIAEEASKGYKSLRSLDGGEGKTK